MSTMRVRVIVAVVAVVMLVPMAASATNGYFAHGVGLKAKGMTQVVIDLRSNPGGRLRSTVESMVLFLDKGDKICGTPPPPPEREERSGRGGRRPSGRDDKGNRNDRNDRNGKGDRSGRPGQPQTSPPSATKTLTSTSNACGPADCLQSASVSLGAGICHC